jgi:DNA-binding HxlR family transcriptional regulator
LTAPSSNLALSAPLSGATEDSGQHAAGRAACCPLYHEAVELVGKRWTGAIMHVLMFAGPLRFSEIAQAVPELSDRLLSQRMKELESRGLVERRVMDGSPVRVQYALTQMGRDLGPALLEIKAWAHRWLARPGRSVL